MRPSPKNGLALQEKKLAPATYAKAVWTLETLVCPYIGSRPIAKLGAANWRLKKWDPVTRDSLKPPVMSTAWGRKSTDFGLRTD